MRGISIGIDVGSTAITTAVVRRERNGILRLIALSRAPTSGIRRGTIIDPLETSRAVRTSVAEASKLSGLKIKSGVVAFSGAGVVSSISRGVVAISRADGEITGEDVKRATQAAEALHPKSPNREIIHIVPREFRVDNETGIRDPVGMVGMRLEAETLILDAQKPALQNLVKVFEGAGIEIEEWLFAPIAAAEAVLTAQQRELGVMLLDIGGGTSDYAVFEEGRLIDAGLVPIGGERITQDIAVGFKTNIGVAELVKLKYGQMLSDALSKRDLIKLAEFVEDDGAVYSQRELADIIQARVADIFELAERALHKVNRQSRLSGGVVLVGGTSQLPGIREFARREMRLSVERGIIQGLDIPESLGGGTDVAVALGITLWHLRETGGLSTQGSLPLKKAVSGLKEWLRVFLP